MKFALGFLAGAAAMLAALFIIANHEEIYEGA